MRYDERLHFYLPDDRDERVHDALVNPSAGGLVGSQDIHKTFNASALIVGSNTLLTVTGGVVRLESFIFRVTQAFTSGGAPTFQLLWPGSVTMSNAAALAALTLGAMSVRDAATTITIRNTYAAGYTDPATMPNPTATAGFGTIVNSDLSPAAVLGNVVGAVYTGGAFVIDCVYTPITPGATLS